MGSPPPPSMSHTFVRIKKEGEPRLAPMVVRNAPLVGGHRMPGPKKQVARVSSATYTMIQDSRTGRIVTLNEKKEKDEEAPAEVSSSGASSRGEFSLSAVQLKRTRHPGFYQHQVLNYLREHRQPATLEHLQRELEIPGVLCREVGELLRRNTKILFQDGKFVYKSEFTIQNIDELQGLINHHVNGIDVETLKDAYKGVLEDVQTLSTKGKVALVLNEDTKRNVIFPFFPERYEVEPTTVDPDVRKLWSRVRLPHPAEIENEVRKAGIKLMEVEEVELPRPKEEEKKKRRRTDMARQVRYNVHIDQSTLKEEGDTNPEGREPCE